MIDAVGRPQRVLVVGATSDIATATVHALVAEGGVESMVLTARDPAALEGLVAELGAKGVASHAVAWDALAGAEAAAATVEAAWAAGDVDLVLVAAGVLPDEAAVRADPRQLAATIDANLTGPATLALFAAQRMQAQGHGTLVLLSTVTAERSRASLLVYAAGKTGLDAFGLGLGDALLADGVNVVVVRPGFVHSKMTAGLAPAPLATTPEKVGADIVAAIRGGVSGPVWSPKPVRLLMAVLRHLPRPLWRRISADR